MKISSSISQLAANLILGFLVVLGATGLFWVVPAMAAGLAAQFSEYQANYEVLVLLLGAPVLLGTLLLVLIMILLQRIRLQQMFSRAALQWVQGLIVATTALAASFAAIGIWLTSKNTLPPLVFFALLTLGLISLAVALVTNELRGLLSNAIATSEELSEVI